MLGIEAVRAKINSANHGNATEVNFGQASRTPAQPKDRLAEAVNIFTNRRRNPHSSEGRVNGISFDVYDERGKPYARHEPVKTSLRTVFEERTTATSPSTDATKTPAA